MVSFRWFRAMARVVLGLILLAPVVALPLAVSFDRGPAGEARLSPHLFPLVLWLFDDFAWTCARNSVIFASPGLGALAGRWECGLGWVDRAPAVLGTGDPSTCRGGRSWRCRRLFSRSDSWAFWARRSPGPGLLNPVATNGPGVEPRVVAGSCRSGSCGSGRLFPAAVALVTVATAAPVERLERFLGRCCAADRRRPVSGLEEPDLAAGTATSAVRAAALVFLFALGRAGRSACSWGCGARLRFRSSRPPAGPIRSHARRSGPSWPGCSGWPAGCCWRWAGRISDSRDPSRTRPPWCGNDAVAASRFAVVHARDERRLIGVGARRLAADGGVGPPCDAEGVRSEGAVHSAGRSEAFSTWRGGSAIRRSRSSWSTRWFLVSRSLAASSCSAGSSGPTTALVRRGRPGCAFIRPIASAPPLVHGGRCPGAAMAGRSGVAVPGRCRPRWGRSLVLENLAGALDPFRNPWIVMSGCVGLALAPRSFRAGGGRHGSNRRLIVRAPPSRRRSWPVPREPEPLDERSPASRPLAGPIRAGVGARRDQPDARVAFRPWSDGRTSRRRVLVLAGGAGEAPVAGGRACPPGAIAVNIGGSGPRAIDVRTAATG